MPADSLRKASTPRILGLNPLWHHQGWKLPDYIEHVASHLIPKHGESKGIAMAIGIIRDWAAGRMPNGKGKPDAGTIAAAQKALAEWEALKAKAAAVRASKGGRDGK